MQLFYCFTALPHLLYGRTKSLSIAGERRHKSATFCAFLKSPEQSSRQASRVACAGATGQKKGWPLLIKAFFSAAGCSLKGRTPLCGEEKWPIGRKNGDAYRRFLTSSRDKRKFADRCGRGPGAVVVGGGKGEGEEACPFLQRKPLPE